MIWQENGQKNLRYMTIEQRNEFVINWLRQEGLYDSYRTAFRARCAKDNVGVDKKWNDLMSMDEPSDIFSAAFAFGDTPDGHLIWPDAAIRFCKQFK